MTCFIIMECTYNTARLYIISIVFQPIERPFYQAIINLWMIWFLNKYRVNFCLLLPNTNFKKLSENFSGIGFQLFVNALVYCGKCIFHASTIKEAIFNPTSLRRLLTIQFCIARDFARYAKVSTEMFASRESFKLLRNFILSSCQNCLFIWTQLFLSSDTWIYFCYRCAYVCVCVLVRNLNLLRPIANYERLINIIFGFSLNRLKRQARYLIERDPFRCESFKGLNYNTFKVYLWYFRNSMHNTQQMLALKFVKTFPYNIFVVSTLDNLCI